MAGGAAQNPIMLEDERTLPAEGSGARLRSVVADEQPAGCPFAELHVGPAHIQRYLSDRSQRLRGQGLWMDTERRAEELMDKGGVRLAAELDKLGRVFQERTQFEVVALRSEVFNMARTLVELLLYTKQGDTELQKECSDQLHAAVSKIKMLFQSQCEKQQALEKQHHTAMLKHASDAECAATATARCTHGAGAAATLAALFSACPIAAWFKPGLFGNVDIVRQWYRPTHRDASGTLHYALYGAKLSSKWLFSLVGIATIMAGSASLSCWASARLASLRRRHDILADACALHRLNNTQNTRMWEGIFICVEDVDRSAKQLESTNPRRESRIRATIEEIGWKLFGMSMAVDEYIVWLSRHHYFPQNYSVRNLLQPERYDAIVAAFEAVRAQGTIADDAASAASIA